MTAYGKINELETRVRLSTLDTGKRRGAWHESLLDCFREARGFGRATVFDARGNPSHHELATLMMSPFASFWDISDRASTYHDRALKKHGQGRLSEARCDYQDGLDFISWCLYLGRHGHGHLNVPEDLINKKDKILKKDQCVSPLQMWTKIGFSCASLCIDLGDFGSAMENIDWTLDMQWKGRIKAAEPEAWCLYGQRDLAAGFGSGAIYCWLQTLWKEPGHVEADEAVDEWEAGLREISGLYVAIDLHNIQHVLQPFRHQTRGSPVMSKIGYERLFREWITGVKEVNSIGYRHCHDGSVSLEQSNRRKYRFH